MKTKDKNQHILNKVIYGLTTPANAHINALESFLTTASDKIDAEEKELIELTLNSCMQVQKLIENLNFICKSDNESLKLNYEKFNISEIIENVSKENNILLKYNNLSIKHTNEDIVVYADKTHIKRAIENLLSYCINNAHKNSQIEILSAKINSHACIQIKTKGNQVSFQDLNNLFENNIYYTSYNKTLTNLGLYLTKEIINLHCGKIINHNYPNNTNIIGFSIPIK